MLRKYVMSLWKIREKLKKKTPVNDKFKGDKNPHKICLNLKIKFVVLSSIVH